MSRSAIHHATNLTPRQIGAGLGKIVRYAGRGQFCPVLLHCLAVADFLPDSLKFFGLNHDMSEVLLSDIPSPYKNTELRELEKEIFAEMSKHHGVRLPTKSEQAQVKHADHRSRQAEIFTVGDKALRSEYPIRDRAAERLTVKYHRKYPATDCIKRNGRAVAEFCRRWKLYKAMIKQ